MFRTFTKHNDQDGKCKFILAGESGKFNEERIGGHLPMSYHLWYGRGAVAYFIFKVFQNPSAEIGFGATLSAYHRQPTFGIGEH